MNLLIKRNSVVDKIVFLLFLLLMNIVYGQLSISKLQVDYQTQPLGIDVQTPRFSWQMKEEDATHGHYQTAYQILVADEADNLVWDSGKIESAISLGVEFGGEALQQRTRYTYEVMVWDENGKKLTASSWFETGLMDSVPASEVWNGAAWIGGSEEDIPFYSHYSSVFKLQYTLQLDAASKSTKASMVFGANDRRLQNKDLNIQGVANRRDESFIRLELDISGFSANEGHAQLHVFRVGYSPEDSNDKPFLSFPIATALLNDGNKYEPHTFYAYCNFGLFDLYLNGTEDANRISHSDLENPSRFNGTGFNLNPVGRGNNYISFPMLADIGFYAGSGQKARFSEVKVRNFREPSNAVWQLTDTDFGAENSVLNIDGGDQGELLIKDPSKNSEPMLRTNFDIGSKRITKARLYTTARGIYEFYINGERVGDHYFSPGLTQYNKTHMYQTYDVTSLLKSGENAMGAWLSEGWWSGNITYSGENWNFFGDRQSVRGQLIITYEDDSEEIITTNDEWQLFTDGPIVYGSYFQGEVYDATKEAAIEGWSAVGFDASDWKKASIVPLEGTAFPDLDYDNLELVGQWGENPSIIKTLDALNVEEVRPGVFVYDMGQNMVGFPKIKLPKGKKGDTITLRYAEVRYPNLSEYEGNIGMIMLENIRAALTQDVYIRNGGEETVQPRFTFHGFRYLEITGVDKAVPLEDVKGLVVSSIPELGSSYVTSNELVKKLWENITWSLRGNFLSIPTDTPARNERMGWSGDINVFSRASTYLADVNPFLRRHLLAMRDIQREDGRFTDVAPVGGGFGGTLWGSAGIIVAWELYLQYGDLQVLREHYPAMKKYVAFLTSKIDPETGIINEGPLGDWLSPEGYKNDDTLLWAAYHMYDLEILAKTAELLGHTDDADAFRKEYKERKAFLNTTYFDAETGKTIHQGNSSLRFGPPLPEEMQKKKGDFMDTQASYAIPLELDVLSDENKTKAVTLLDASIQRKNMDELGVERPEYSLMTGFIGTASLNHALSENGRHETAYTLLQRETYPSWLYPVVNGATTIWERLNSYTLENGFGGNNSMNSFNHYSFGAVAAWMYNYSLGIQRDPKSPGFKHFILEPIPDPTRKMTWAKGHYDSMYGRIESGWKYVEEGWEYETTIPANTTATLRLNIEGAKNISLNGKKLRKGKGVLMVRNDEKEVVLKLTSGHYHFVIKK